MPNKNEQPGLPDSLIHTIETSDLSSLGKDLAEVGLDSVLKDGLLRDIPVFGSIVGIWKLGRAINDELFLRKLLAFLADLANIPPAKRAEMLAQLDSDDALESTGERLLALLDRLDSARKAALLGKGFRLLAEGAISPDEFWRVSLVLDRLPMSDVHALKTWRQVALNRVEHIRKHLYLSCGIGWFVVDASSTGFQWQERLCTIFSDHLLD
jgi:hypothetical protein